MDKVVFRLFTLSHGVSWLFSPISLIFVSDSNVRAFYAVLVIAGIMSLMSYIGLLLFTDVKDSLKDD
jgi:hypothetical protein